MQNTLIQCFSFGLILSQLMLHNLAIPLPGPSKTNTSKLVFSDFNCTEFSPLPETYILLNDTNFLMKFNDSGIIKCHGRYGTEPKVDQPVWDGVVHVELKISDGMVNNVFQRRTSTTCRADSFTTEQCNMNVSFIRSYCDDPNWLNNITCNLAMKSIEKLWPELIWPLVDPTVHKLCDGIAKLIGNLLIDQKSPTPTPIPSPRYDAPPLLDNDYIKMANNLVGKLPELSGAKLSLSVPGKNYANFGINFEKNISFGSEKDIPPIPGVDPMLGPVFDLQLPRGLKLDLDLVLQYFVCKMSTGFCNISGLAVYNLRLRDFNDLDMGLDSIANFFVAALIDPRLDPYPNRTYENNTMNFTLFPSKTMGGPPPFVYGLIGIVPASITIFLTVSSIYYHLRRARMIERNEQERIGSAGGDDVRSPLTRGDDPFGGSTLITADGRAVRTVFSYSVFRGVLRDFIIVFLCNSAMLMFVYANATTAVTVTIGGSVRIFAFSLRNSVHDFWVSGLKALSFFIAFFSGAYPYVKLVVIVVISVVTRNTKSRLLRVIDSLGRYSFLDSFVMMVLVTTLQVPGIATVNAYPPFYSFILATVISMVAGNIACHTYDPGLIVEEIEITGAAEEVGVSNPQLARGYGSNGEDTDNLDGHSGGGTKALNINKSSTTVNTSSTIYDESAGEENNNNNNGSSTIYNATSADSNKKSTTTTKLVNKILDASLLPNDEQEAPSNTKFANGEIDKTSSSKPRSNNNNNNNKDDDKLYDFNNFDESHLEKPCLNRPTWIALAIIGAAIVWTGIWYGWVHPTLRYKFSGFVTFLKGTHQDYSLQRLFFESPRMLGVVATINIVAFPLIMTLFPHDTVLSYLAPWCSTDVFLLTCLAALLQLHDFIKYQAGPILGMMINARAEFHSGAIALLACAAVTQWVYIVRAAIGKDPHKQRSSTGKPAEDNAPPHLFFREK